MTIKNKIDFIITWVDGSDIKWKEEKNKYSPDSNDSIRFRDWDQLKYWFRGVEKYAPWVNKIYFITCGQKPSWLNEKNEKLVLINHHEYIPLEFLPTFSSHPIELNFHRIKELSDNFVYFNDDMFLINKVGENDFFRNNTPCDDYIEVPLTMIGNNDPFNYILANNMEIINKNFDKRNVYSKNRHKFFSYKYGLKNNLKTLLMLPNNYFSSFQVTHLPASFNKETFIKVWEREGDMMRKTCKNKFRSKDDINQYIFKYWQYCTGNFFPRASSFGKSYIIANDNEEIIDVIINKKYKVICLNDNDKINFEKAKEEINTAFEKIFPEKSSFEK